MGCGDVKVRVEEVHTGRVDDDVKERAQMVPTGCDDEDVMEAVQELPPGWYGDHGRTRLNSIHPHPTLMPPSA